MVISIIAMFRVITSMITVASIDYVGRSFSTAIVIDTLLSSSSASLHLPSSASSSSSSL